MAVMDAEPIAAPPTMQASGMLRQYIDEVGELPADVLLGRMVIYSISDEPVAHDQLERWFTELGLDKSLMPAPIRELDAFKKATSEIDKRTYPLSNDRTGIALCRQVTSNDEVVIRQVTREIRDSKRKKLFYDNAIEARFYRAPRGGSPRIKVKVNQDNVLSEEVEPLKELAQSIGENYQRFVNYHDGQKLRGIVRNYLLHLNAIEIRGGVYFIHVSRDAELTALAELVNRFGGTCEMNTIPMVDLQSERQYMTRIFEREASESLSSLTKKARELMTQPNVTPRAAAQIQSEYDEILQKAQEHMVRLQVDQDITAASAEITHNVLQELMKRVVGV